MGLIAAFLDKFSDSLMAAVALWPLASFALTLPILAWLYHRDGELRPGPAAAAYAAVFYALGLGCFTLYPLPSGTEGLGITYGIPWQLNPLAFVGDLAREGMGAVPQIVSNVLFFVPLGVIGARLARWGFGRTLAVGLAVSLLIEVAQGTGLFGVYPYAYRTADVDDLLWNGLGAAAGWLLADRLARSAAPRAVVAEKPAVTGAPTLVQRCVALWIDATLACIAWAALFGTATLVGAGMDGWSADARLVLEALTGPTVLVALFVFVELVVPWSTGGQTPGGAFVRMTCESHVRTTARRLAFYLVRLATIAAAVVMPLVSVPLIGLFYLVERRMPCDLV